MASLTCFGEGSGGGPEAQKSGGEEARHPIASVAPNGRCYVLSSLKSLRYSSCSSGEPARALGCRLSGTGPTPRRHGRMYVRKALPICRSPRISATVTAERDRLFYWRWTTTCARDSRTNWWRLALTLLCSMIAVRRTTV